jgi:hypothetical protein
MKPITDPEEREIFEETYKAISFLDRTSFNAYMDLGKLDGHIFDAINVFIKNKKGNPSYHVAYASAFVIGILPSYSDEYSLESWDDRLDTLRNRGISKEATDRWHVAYMLFTKFLEGSHDQLSRQILQEEPSLQSNFSFNLTDVISAVRRPLSDTYLDMGRLKSGILTSDDHKLPSDFKSGVTDKAIYKTFQAANQHGFIGPEFMETDLKSLESLLGHTLVTNQHL